MNSFITIILTKSAFSNFRGRTKTLPSARPRLFRYRKKWHNIWKQHDRGGVAIFRDRGSEEKDWPGSMIEVLPRCLLHSGCVAEIEASMRSCGHRHGHPIAGDGARRRPTACGDHCCSSGRVVTGSCRCVPPCPGWPAWISPLLPSTSLPRARRSATMDPPAGGSREPAVLPCCSG